MAGSRGGGKSVSLLEALEDYTNSHPEPISELLKWPASKWERFHELHQKRKLIGELEQQRNAMIAALWSNSNWDDDKGTRRKVINDLLAQHEDAVESIEAALSSRRVVQEEEKLSQSNPFFAATERGLQKIEKVYEESGKKVVPEQDVPDYMHGLDQEQDG